MSRTPSSGQLVLVTVVGAVSLGTGWVLTRRPTVVFDAVPDLVAILEAIDPGWALLALVSVLVVLAPLLGFLGRVHAEPPRPIGSRSTQPQRSAVTPGSTPAPSRTDSRSGLRVADSSGSSRVVGSDLEAAIERATDYDGASRPDREAAREALVAALRPIATGAYARQHGIDDDRALEVVAAGTWTTDVRAGAFLADEDGRSTPLSVWLYDLVTASDPFRRSLVHAIDAIDEMQSNPGVTGDS